MEIMQYLLILNYDVYLHIYCFDEFIFNQIHDVMKVNYVLFLINSI
jgi:hypothetical protein